MFLRILRDSLVRQKQKKMILFASVALGASVVGAMLNIALEIGDRIQQELRGYGANIHVGPLGDTLPLQIGGLDLSDLKEGEWLEEGHLLKIREMFWRNNILGYAPFLPLTVSVQGEKVTLVGTWFHRRFELPGGEKYEADVRDVRPYWSVRGGDLWPHDSVGVIVGVSLARRLHLKEGQVIPLHYQSRRTLLVVRGILEVGGEEDDQIFTHLPVVQSLGGLGGKIKEIQVSALTHPENDLFEKYRKNPALLTPQEIERYSCTPYLMNIVGELTEKIPNATASPILQVAATEGRILKKIVLLMALVALAALVTASIAVTGSVTAMVVDRRKEIGLLKALGADYRSVLGLLLSEGLIVGMGGGAVGYLLGSLFSWVVGMRVFSHPIGPKSAAAPLIILLACLMTLLGSFVPARRVLLIDPAKILKGD